MSDADDASFVGVRPEVEQILRAADERIGNKITKEQERAAQVMARLLDVASVDEALDLAPGEVMAWMDEQAFVERVVVYRALVMDRVGDEDFGRILTPEQRAAARMLRLDMLSKVEVARALEVTDRTIRNWTKNPAFGMYQDQLEHEEEKQRRARLRTQSDQLSEAKKKALVALVQAVEEGDRKAAIELLRLRP